MRMGVLDIGSNTGHLLVVDAHRGAAPVPAYSYKEPLRLAEHLDSSGAVSQTGIDALVKFVDVSVAMAEDKGCLQIKAFATSAVRDSVNADAVLEEVRDQTGVTIDVLAGGDEARLTFLAVRRWRGWSAGRILMFDIGGGSLEIALGMDESPDVALSLPLGAARLTREWFADGHDPESLRQLRRHVRGQIASEAGSVLRLGGADVAVATSKTFRSLSRICGAAPSTEAPTYAGSFPAAGSAAGCRSSSPCRWSRSPSFPASRRTGPTRSSPVVSSRTPSWTCSTCPSCRCVRGPCGRA